MPNLAMGPVMPQLLQMLGQQSQIQETQAHTDLIKTQTSSMQRQMQLDEEYRQAQIQSEAMAGFMNPTKNSLDQDRAEQSSTLPSKNLVAGIQADIDQAKAQRTQAAQYGQPTATYDSAIRALTTQQRLAQRDLFKEQEDQAKETAQMAGGVDSGTGLAALIQRVADTQGKGAAFQLDKQFQHDANDIPVFNENAKKILGSMADKYTTASQKEKQRQDAATLDLAKQRFDLAKQAERDRILEADQRAANANTRFYAGLNERKKEHADVMQRFGAGMSVKDVKEGQGIIEKDADKYNIRENLQSYEKANFVEKKLKDPAQGFESVTEAEARDLVDNFKRQLAGYSKRGSTAYGDKEIAKMNGMIQNMEKYFKTWGHGDTLLAQDQMLNLTETMKRAAMDQNIQVVKGQLQVQDTMRKKGTDPGLVYRTYGDIDLLKKEINPATNKPYAIEISKDGHKYLSFSPTDSLPLPRPPERPRIPTYGEEQEEEE